MANDEVNYQRLLSEDYLLCGGKVRRYLNSFLIVKIAKVIRKMGALKKRRRKKDAAPKRGNQNSKKKETKN